MNSTVQAVLNATKIGVSIGLGILVLGIMVIVQTILKDRKVNNIKSIKSKK